MWLLLDLLLVGLFAVVGRLSHYGSLSPAGWATTAWPFLVGVVLTWGVLRAVGRPATTVPAGIAVWLGTLVVGMVLRQLSGQGTAVAFVIVATLVLGVLLVLPRVLLRLRPRLTPRARG